MSSEIILSGPTVFIRLGVPGAYYTFRPWEWALILGGCFFEAGRQERIKVSSKLIRKLILIVHWKLFLKKENTNKLDLRGNPLVALYVVNFYLIVHNIL